MPKKAHPKRGVRGTGLDGLERNARTPMKVVAAVAIAAAGLWIYFEATPPPPEIVTPAAAELLDPDVRKLIEWTVAMAEAEPSVAASHGRLGMVYEANSLWAEARDSYAVAARLDPDEHLWRYHLAVATQQAGDYSQALTMYRAIGAAEPGFGPVHERLAWALLENGDLDAARAAFERVIEAAPGRPNGLVGAATVLRIQGSPEEAVERLQRALEIEPDHRPAHYQLGLAYRDLGRSRDADRELSLGIGAKVRLLPDPLSDEIGDNAVGLAARLERAEALRQAGRHEDVAKLFEQALSTRPENLTLLNGLAAAYLSLERFGRAREILSRALEVDPSGVETRLNLAGLALATGQTEQAIEHADRALAIAPRLARLHAVRAQALLVERRYGEAIPSLEEAIRLEVRDPALYLVLGVLYSELQRWESARDVYARAVSSWPDLTPAHLGSCEASLALGDLAAARASLDRLERLQPDHPRLDELRRAVGGRAGTSG